jgi:CRISPR/Cas system-associated endonuclease Cas1
MLNYAYAVLIAQTQIRLIVEGYDPTVGIMHEKKALRGINPGFALDHMEPMRPVVDRAVLQLIDAVTFTGADFSIQHDGVCRMNPELARRVAQLALEQIESVSQHPDPVATSALVERWPLTICRDPPLDMSRYFSPG